MVILWASILVIVASSSIHFFTITSLVGVGGGWSYFIVASYLCDLARSHMVGSALFGLSFLCYDRSKGDASMLYVVYVGGNILVGRLYMVGCGVFIY